MCPTSAEQLPPPPILPATVFNELCSYLRESGSTLSPSEALIKAVQLWIATGRADAIPAQSYLKERAAVPPTPAESMKIAAKAMSDALSTALTLVAHANDQAQNTLERRLPKYRRAWDMLEDVD